MKLTIEKAAAEQAMKRVLGIVEKRNTIAILGNVALTCADDKLTIRARGLDIEAIEVADCHTIEPGETTVPATKLAEVIASFATGAEINMDDTTTPSRLTVKAGRSRFNLPTLPVQDFPAITAETWPISFTVNGAELSAILARTVWAAGSNESQHLFNATYIHVKDGQLRAVATNGRKLAYADMASTAPADFSTILPAKTAAELQSRLAGTGDVTFQASPTRVCIIIGGASISSKVVDGNYLAYERTIPSGLNSTVKVDADDLTAAVRAALIASDGKVRGIRLNLSANAVTVTGRTADSDAAGEIEADYDGPEISFGLNGEYVLGCLSALNADAIEILIADDKRPCIWRKAGDETAIGMFAPLKG